MEIIKHLSHMAEHAHQVMPRFRWIHKCEDNNTVHLPASVNSCPHCDAVNTDHQLADMATFPKAA